MKAEVYITIKVDSRAKVITTDKDHFIRQKGQFIKMKDNNPKCLET